MIDKMKSSKRAMRQTKYDLIWAGKKNSYNIFAGGPRSSKAEGWENL